jgi:hypothetical protein
LADALSWLVADYRHKEAKMKNTAKALLLAIILIMSLGLLAGPTAAAVKLVKGQTLYLPCSTRFIKENFPFNIKATIFIYNTDPSQAITIVKMDFYDTSGKFVKKYLEHPLKLEPSAGTYIRVESPLKGEAGAAAHFIVQWQAKTKVVQPIIKCLMLGSRGNRGYTFVSPARVIHEID